MTKNFRIEKDSMGTIEVPIEALWGAQTQRSIKNFSIGEELIPIELIYSLTLIKKAASIANFNLGLIDKSKKDFKTVDMFEMCIWDCQIFNPNIYDEAMYVGRIQINLNDGKKRKFLYFQSDYKIKNTYSDYIPSEGDRDDDELEGFGG